MSYRSGGRGFAGLSVARRRVAANWALHALRGETSVRLGFLTDTSGRLAEFGTPTTTSPLPRPAAPWPSRTAPETDGRPVPRSVWPEDCGHRCAALSIAVVRVPFR